MGFATIVRLVWVGLAVVVAGAALRPLLRRRQDSLLARIRAEWGRLTYRDCDFPALLEYHRARKDEGPSLDDRTWEDLNLDSVFTVLDRTESAAGQQALYHRLRSPQVGPTLEAFDTLVK